MSRSRVVLLVLALVGALSAAVAPTASAQPGAFVAGGLYKTSYSSTIYVLESTSGMLTRRAIGYQEWRDRGFAAPRVLPSATVKYPWAPTLFADTSWPFGSVIDRLDLESWTAAGRPTPRDVGFLRFSSIDQYATGDELFLFPGCADNQPSCSDFLHKLTADEWAATGFAPFFLNTRFGYTKLSWDSTIYSQDNLPSYDRSRAMTYDSWVAFGRPTPRVSDRLPGDQFLQDCRTSVITYAGPTTYRQITYREWQLAGSPVPTRTGC